MTNCDMPWFAREPSACKVPITIKTRCGDCSKGIGMPYLQTRLCRNCASWSNTSKPSRLLALVRMTGVALNDTLGSAKLPGPDVPTFLSRAGGNTVGGRAS